MTTINIIRSLLELIMILGVSFAVYKLSILRDGQKERGHQTDKPVQFTGKDFFSIDLDD
ncbi:MAG TPA: hypothetical protein VFD25_05415 [Clostridia bacterium]|nr:hypothetical protein [Clostridia bacterium]